MIPPRPSGPIPGPPADVPAPSIPGSTPAGPIAAGRGGPYTAENKWVKPKTLGEWIRRYGGSYANAAPGSSGSLWGQVQQLLGGGIPNLPAAGPRGFAPQAPAAPQAAPSVRPSTPVAPARLSFLPDPGLTGEQYPLLSQLIKSQQQVPPPNYTV